MQTLKLAAAAGALGAAFLTFAAPAWAATVINPVNSPPFDLSNSVGTINPVTASVGDTYDFTFSTTGNFVVLTQLQASDFVNGSDPLDFTLFAGTPGSGVAVATTPLMTGPSLIKTLAAGSYYLQTGTISTDGELLTGGLEVLAASAPEPGTWLMMLVGVVSLGGALRLHQRSASLGLTA